MRLLLCSCFLIACSEPSSEVASPQDAVEEPAVEPSVEAGPEGTDRLAAHLGARHARDLPSAEQLATYPDFAASLRWIATHDERMIARARALGLLRHDRGPETRALLLSVIDDGDAHPSLRAAAIAGTSGLSLDPGLLARLDTAARDSDPRVRHAAEARRVSTDAPAIDAPAIDAPAQPATGNQATEN